MIAVGAVPDDSHSSVQPCHPSINFSNLYKTFYKRLSMLLFNQEARAKTRKTAGLNDKDHKQDIAWHLFHAGKKWAELLWRSMQTTTAITSSLVSLVLCTCSLSQWSSANWVLLSHT